MKPVLASLFSLFIFICFPLQARADSLCASKVSMLRNQGKRNVSCNESNAVDFGNRTFSSDYQNPQSEPLSAPVGSIKKKNKDGSEVKFFEDTQKKEYGIKNLYYLTEQYRPALAHPEKLTEQQKKDAYGASTTMVLLSAFQQAYPQDRDISDYITNDLTKSLTPDPTRSAWNGRCLQWSVWNTSEEPLDVKFKTLLRGMERGVLCDGTWPLSAGVLKEIWTAITVEPREDTAYEKRDYQKKELRHLYDDADHSGNTRQNIEDANLALIKLQDFGTGSDFKPDSLVDLAKQSKANHQQLVFDMNAGKPVWNQPIETIVEVTYEDPSPSDEQKYLTAADLQSGSGGQSAYESFLRLETSLKRKALSDDHSRASELCSVRSLIGESCTELPNQMPVSAQVNELKRIQALALKQGILRKQSGASVVHHQIFIEYGTEGDFGDSKNAPAKTRVLNFVKVGDRPGAWSSPSRKLSEACADGNFGDRDEQKDSLFAPVSESCMSACKKRPQYMPGECGEEREIFAGSLPPKNFKLLRRHEIGRSERGEDGKKLAAQQKLLNLIQEHCPSYDNGARFLDRLKLALSKNNISPQDQAALIALYPKAKNFLSANFIDEALHGMMPGAQPASIPGLSELRQKLK
ncbi:MAG: hypothetical protein H7333_05580 [Bdellovibrionales bacterium]|nr:hypothetical protein [Oligoflexia bacterium]